MNHCEPMNLYGRVDHNKTHHNFAISLLLKFIMSDCVLIEMYSSFKSGVKNTIANRTDPTSIGANIAATIHNENNISQISAWPCVADIIHNTPKMAATNLAVPK